MEFRKLSFEILNLFQGMNVAIRQMKHKKTIDLRRSVLMEVKMVNSSK